MKYNFWIIFLTVLGSFQLTYAQFNFKQHKVIKGEDVYSIAKEYRTTPEAIYKLNPMAKEGIQPNAFIVLPNVITPPEKNVEGIAFKKHKTKSKQTLYSVAKKYNVSIDDIKEHNVFLKTEPLRKGDIVRIPLKAHKVVRKVGSNEVIVESPATKIYTIQPKDTRYGVARKFGITIPELENMNPNLGQDFPIGDKILVSSEEAFSKTPEKEINNPNYKLYEVLPKETLYSLSKRHEISIDSIEMLNPNVKQGLKAGMILRLPVINRQGALLKGDHVFVTDLENNLTNLKPKKIALMLPFSVNAIDFSDEEKVKEHLSKSKVVRLSVDFYSGVLLAAEKAKQKGISSHIEVCDTEKSEAKVSQLISQKNLSTYDAVIGPLYKKNVVKAASILQSSKVPVFSPVSNKLQSGHDNLYQTLPSINMLEDKLIAFAKQDTLTKNIIIIADKKSSAIKEKLKKQFPKAQILDPQEGGFITEEDLIAVISKEEEKDKGKEKKDEEAKEIPLEERAWVFLESKSMALISNVLPFLNARAKSHQITLFTTNKTRVYDNESILNQHLSNLNMHYASVKNEEFNTERANFIGNYIAKYGEKPNDYAIRGFDLTYDLLLRLSSKEENTALSSSEYLTEYVGNKFDYKNNSRGGVSNSACYILKYVEGLNINKVK